MTSLYSFLSEETFIIKRFDDVLVYLILPEKNGACGKVNFQRGKTILESFQSNPGESADMFLGRVNEALEAILGYNLNFSF